MKKIILFATLLLSSWSVFAQQAELPKMMPDWQLKHADGSLVSSKDLAGTPLILHFWATWCPYCKRLQPRLDEIAKTFEKQGLKVIAVSISEPENAQPQRVLEERGLQLKTLLHGDKLAFEHFNVIGTPTTVFVAPDGRILGATMASDPEHPQWHSVAEYLAGLSSSSKESSKKSKK